jgi:hypothetical protein
MKPWKLYTTAAWRKQKQTVKAEKEYGRKGLPGGSLQGVVPSVLENGAGDRSRKHYDPPGRPV